MFTLTELLLILLAVFIAMNIKQQPIIINTPDNKSVVSAVSGDDRYRRAPRPQRIWDIGQETPVRGALGGNPASTLLDPIPTRGAPDSYQQMGVMIGSDGKALPLYGRRTAPRSDKFNYYTRTDTYNPVALPVEFMNRDCQDNQGCNEISSGDTIKITPTGETSKVTLYGFDGPRYSPDIA